MGQVITVARITRATNKDTHDAYIMPTGRIYYRHNLGRFEGMIPPGLGTPLVELRRCVKEVKDQAVHHLQARDMFDSTRKLRRLVEPHNCSFAVHQMEVDRSAL